MSRRTLLARIAGFAAFGRSYVGTPQEIEAYHAEKRRALDWIAAVLPRSSKRKPVAPVVIDGALVHHLFDPLDRLPAAPAPPVLARSDSLEGLEICQNMLRDLEPYLTAQNVVRCSERIGNILAYSTAEIWYPDYVPCLTHLCEMIELGMVRCDKPQLSILLRSLGKWGKAAVTVALQNGSTVHDLFSNLLDRLCDEGVRGELDAQGFSNVLNACVQLDLFPGEAFHRVLQQQLEGKVEFAPATVLTRLLMSFAKLRIGLSGQIRQNLALTIETKLRGGSYPSNEIPLMLCSLGLWQRKGEPFTLGLCAAAENELIQWGWKTDWTLRQFLLMLQGFLGLQYFPSAALLERVCHEAKALELPESFPLWAVLLSLFAEFGVRPVCLIECCTELLEDVDHIASITVKDVASLVKSLALMNCLTPNMFSQAGPFLQGRLTEMQESDKASVYVAYLHLKYLSDASERLQIDEHFLKICRQSWRTLESFRQQQDAATALENSLSFSEVHVADDDLGLVSLADRENCAVFTNVLPFLNASGRIRGSDLWRKRLLRRLEWTWVDNFGDPFKRH